MKYECIDLCADLICIAFGYAFFTIDWYLAKLLIPDSHGFSSTIRISLINDPLTVCNIEVLSLTTFELIVCPCTLSRLISISEVLLLIVELKGFCVDSADESTRLKLH